MKLNSKNFIKLAQDVHDSKYVYDNVVYINTKTKVEVICPIHGSFWVSPGHHIRSRSGCPACSGVKKKTQEEFIQQAQLIHKNKYDYSKVEYKNNKTKVCIICPEHGEFWQVPYDHLKGIGCKKCWYDRHTKEQTLTKEQFLERCYQKHGNKYDYSYIEYVNLNVPIKIICPIHGEFMQVPTLHLKGVGCPKCGRETANNSEALTTKDFIKRAKEIHKNKYNYSLVNYTRNHNKVTIICKHHGEFQQIASGHLLGQGCPKCAIEHAANKRKFTTKEFIEKAREIHGDKYDYSKSVYDGCKNTVVIICPKHGEFKQVVATHLSGKGCPKCILKSQTKLFEKLTTVFKHETFIWEFKAPWLKRMRIDICMSKYKIAIEYDGRQHFVPIDCFGGEEDYKKRVKSDALKDKLCSENGFTLFRLKYDYTEEDFYNLCVEIQKIIDNDKINNN